MNAGMKEKESVFQAIYIIVIVMLKRNFGFHLGEYENIVFVFMAAVGFYLINWLLARFGKNQLPGDDWENKLDILTILVYGIGLLLLKWMQVTNIWLMLLVGGLLATINVIIKLKRRSIKKKMGVR